jgi:hypothetical protein
MSRAMRRTAYVTLMEEKRNGHRIFGKPERKKQLRRLTRKSDGNIKMDIR